MALVKVTGRVYVGGVMSVIQRMQRGDWRRVFLRLRRPAHRDMGRHRDAQQGPTGPWAPLAPSTKARYAREGKRRNRRILARLPNARLTQVFPDRLILRSPVRWSMAHQAGARVGRGAILPQRQFFWIGPQLIAEAKAEFRKALVARWRGAQYP